MVIMEDIYLPSKKIKEIFNKNYSGWKLKHKLKKNKKSMKVLDDVFEMSENLEDFEEKMHEINEYACDCNSFSMDSILGNVVTGYSEISTSGLLMPMPFKKGNRTSIEQLYELVPTEYSLSEVLKTCKLYRKFLSPSKL